MPSRLAIPNVAAMVFVRKRKGNRTSAGGDRSWKIGKDLSSPILMENGLITAPSLRTLAIDAIVATPFYSRHYLRRPGSAPTGSVLSFPISAPFL